MMNHFKKFWYILCESSQLKQSKILSVTICDEALVAFRGTKGEVCVMPDRCLHRCAKLSAGTIKEGKLTCPYHGWVYNSQGQVESIPAHFGQDNNILAKSHAYPVIEQHGYIYVRLCKALTDQKPYDMPKINDKTFKRVRLINDFDNTLANCVENFIDIPHTAYVHKGIFRKVSKSPIHASITRQQDRVQIEYTNETSNLGSFSWLLNPKREPIYHQDNYFAPNITHVIYRLPNQWQYLITSQSVPISEFKTRVFTEICYNFGLFNHVPLTRHLIKRQAQKVIDQDIEILGQQMSVIRQHGEHFWNTSADIIHQLVSQMIDAIKKGKAIHSLPDKKKEITFWV